MRRDERESWTGSLGHEKLMVNEHLKEFEWERVDSRIYLSISMVTFSNLFCGLYRLISTICVTRLSWPTIYLIKAAFKAITIWLEIDNQQQLFSKILIFSLRSHIFTLWNYLWIIGGASCLCGFIIQQDLSAQYRLQSFFLPSPTTDPEP